MPLWPQMAFWGPFVKRFALTCPVCDVGVLWPNGWMIKMKLGKQVGLGPGHIVLDGNPAPLPQMGRAPNFQPISVVAKRLHGSRCHLVGSYDSVQATLC